MNDKAELIRRVIFMKDQGWSNVAIAERLGISESRVRGLLREV